MTLDHTSTIIVANIIEESRLGGPQNRIASVAHRLRELNVQTIVICPDRESGRFVAKLKGLGVSYRLVSMQKLTRSPLGLIRFLINFPADVFAIRAMLVASKANVVHCNGSWQWKGVLAAKLLKLPVVWHLNDTHVPLAVRLVFKFLARGGIGAFIVSAHRVSNYYFPKRRGAEQLYLVRPPVELEVSPLPVKDRISLRKELVVLSVGNINPNKRLEDFIEMANILKSTIGCVVKYIHVGSETFTDGGYISLLKRRNEDRGYRAVHFAGQTDSVASYLSESDIFVCSSLRESGPMCVFEAMAFGLPIVTTDVGDLKSMNETGNFARVVPPGDPIALAAAVRELIEDSELRMYLGLNARRYAVEFLDARTAARMHARVYLSVLNSA